ncbi:MAG TPA: ChbG/HpnK family deacetylase [Terracidiphilus sp.]|jgi:predicted glycoside hydrolase/deacetylase ChbG (UPF0249 family)|nr:ChbG/HpnK family deacetylase [Terracidiphilus sp.]
MERDVQAGPQNELLQGAQAESGVRVDAERPRAWLIVNADDWGGSLTATHRILDCIVHGFVSSTSAMVFMKDSERAAALAREHSVDAGLHLNLTQAFTSKDVAPRLRQEQYNIARFLRGGRRGRLLANPLLAPAFEYVVKAQLDEFERLYGRKPRHIDGHHHAHLGANVLRQELLPEGTAVRRNFTFAPGEKAWLNRRFRAIQDWQLARRHGIADYFFNLAPMDDARLRRMLDLARGADVEIECHPERDAEYRFLMSAGLARLGYNVTVTRGYRLRSQRMAASTNAEAGGTPVKTPHIAVCICTYKRPAELKRLLADLDRQKTDGLFTYSIVVADNDAAKSAEAAVEEARRTLAIPVKYCAEPQQGIARARNKVMANADGDYFALIDDDEFPQPDWLLSLLETCREYGVDGVLGPVKRHLDEGAPTWLKRSRLFDRSVHPTGMPVIWRGARTGNALLKRGVIAGDESPFRVEFTAGEDQDFFRRKIEEGRSFVWSSDAVVHETLPPSRWKRMYFVRKALLHGSFAARQPDCGAKSIAKSVLAVPLYALALPFALIAGQHRFMTLLVKLCDHAGKLMSILGIRPVHDRYVSE